MTMRFSMIAMLCNAHFSIYIAGRTCRFLIELNQNRIFCNVTPKESSRRHLFPTGDEKIVTILVFEITDSA